MDLASVTDPPRVPGIRPRDRGPPGLGSDAGEAARAEVGNGVDPDVIDGLDPDDESGLRRLVAEGAIEAPEDLPLPVDGGRKQPRRQAPHTAVEVAETLRCL